VKSKKRRRIEKHKGECFLLAESVAVMNSQGAAQIEKAQCTVVFPTLEEYLRNKTKLYMW